MTHKEKSLQALNQATALYNDWLTNIKMLIVGIKIEESELCTNATSCPLHKWFAHDLNYIQFSNQQAIHQFSKTILDLHSQNFIDYHKIYEIYFPQTSVFKKLFVSSDISENDKILVKFLEKTIVERSKEMLKEIEKLSVQLTMAHESKFLAREENSQAEEVSQSKAPRYYRGQLIKD